MTTKPVRPWYEDLTDSVTALRDAAYEYKVAQRSAKSLCDSVSFERRRVQEGRIHALPQTARTEWVRKPQTRVPHETALFDLAKAYGQLAGNINGAFEQAALLFASGACWAITQVQHGATPDRVQFERDPQETSQLLPRAFEIVGLDRYSESPKLAAAYERFAACRYAAEIGDDLADRDYLADHEASAMHDAFAHAEDTGAAAYAYGLLAERALNFALLPIRHPARTTPVDSPAIPPQARPVDTE
ncbi:hypothetical protein [Streptomyces sp. NPDC005732]|uniref:hypothetical protein n=1 Tax=Streptomyces sp. NPDC005732 TaxID=3157057 RepID=UPI0034021E17